jgi:hypothetical protein
MGEWRYSSTILDLETRWRWKVSFMPRPLYPRGNSPQYHCIWGWVGPRSDLDAVKRKILPLPGIEPRFLSCPALSPSWYRLFWRKGTYIFVSCIIVATSMSLDLYIATISLRCQNWIISLFQPGHSVICSFICKLMYASRPLFTWSFCTWHNRKKLENLKTQIFAAWDTVFSRTLKS